MHRCVASRCVVACVWLRLVCVYVFFVASVVFVFGRLAQMVERPLRMRELGGSIPPMSTSFACLFSARRSVLSLLSRHVVAARCVTNANVSWRSSSFCWYCGHVDTRHMLACACVCLLDSIENGLAERTHWAGVWRCGGWRV